MADIFSKDKRSEVMAAIKGKNTAVELLVFRYLRHQKMYFQKHYKRVPGSPDIALPRKKIAIFIDGDFWHGRTYDKVREKYGPDNFWSMKLARNMERDKAQRGALKDMGWKILAVWESDIKRKRTRQEALLAIRKFLEQQ